MEIGDNYMIEDVGVRRSRSRRAAKVKFKDRQAPLQRLQPATRFPTPSDADAAIGPRSHRFKRKGTCSDNHHGAGDMGMKVVVH